MHLPRPNEGGSFTPPPSGTYPAICYRILDLGTQQTTYKGQPKRAHKILLSWEIKDEEAVTDDGQPMSIHQQYTWSMHEKAALRKALESWRGKAFVDSDFGPGGFDIRKLLGVPCLLGITHTVNDGNTYANITAISKLPKGMEAGELVNKPIYMWLEKGLFDREEFAKLSERMQDKIKSSPEYHELLNGRPIEHIADGDVAAGAPVHPAFDDEIPFAPEWRA